MNTLLLVRNSINSTTRMCLSPPPAHAPTEAATERLQNQGQFSTRIDRSLERAWNVLVQVSGNSELVKTGPFDYIVECEHIAFGL